jgi:hypothetical protein
MTTPHDIRTRKKYAGLLPQGGRLYRYTLRCSCGWSKVLHGTRREADAAAVNHKAEANQ